MSDTPRTESEVILMPSVLCDEHLEIHPSAAYVSAGFARQLERELAAEREANDQLSHGLKFIRAALNCDSSKLDVIVPAIKALTTKLAIAREALELIEKHRGTLAMVAREALDKIK